MVSSRFIPHTVLQLTKARVIKLGMSLATRNGHHVHIPSIQSYGSEKLFAIIPGDLKVKRQSFTKLFGSPHVHVRRLCLCLCYCQETHKETFHEKWIASNWDIHKGIWWLQQAVQGAHKFWTRFCYSKEEVPSGKQGVQSQVEFKRSKAAVWESIFT